MERFALEWIALDEGNSKIIMGDQLKSNADGKFCLFADADKEIAALKSERDAMVRALIDVVQYAALGAPGATMFKGVDAFDSIVYVATKAARMAEAGITQQDIAKTMPPKPEEADGRG